MVNIRLGITPNNPNGWGKSGDTITAHATISISGYRSMDYTQKPVRQSKSGTARASTIGRF